MQKPYKYTIICDKTKRIEETNICPLLHHLQTWEQTDKENIKELTIKVIDNLYRRRLIWEQYP